MTIPVTMRARNLWYCLVRHFPLRLLLCDLDLSAVPRGTYFAHPYEVTVNAPTRWGTGCIVRQNVTVGARRTNDGTEPGAVIGNRVHFGAGCIVLGPVTIGDDAVIGAGAVVLQNVPPGAVAVGNPARVLQRRSP
jgi:serine O-acetyltransferase